MLNRVRNNLIKSIDKVGQILAKTRITPNIWSFLGLFFAFLSGLSYSSFIGNWLLAGLLLLTSGFFDIVDGSVARITNSLSLKGEFIDSNFDRISEIFVYLGIINGGIGEPMMILAALSTSLLVSYIRAKAESINIKLSGIGIGERAERVLLLAMLSIIGYPQIGIIAVLIISLFTVIQRFIYVIRIIQ